MNRDPVFLRVDATPDAGFERFARCMTIAAALQRRRRPVHFLSRLEPASLAGAIRKGACEWTAMKHPLGDPADLAQVQAEIAKRNPAAIFVDGEPDRRYLQELVSAGPLVASVDHQGLVRSPSHVVVNPLLGPSREGYEHAPYAQTLMGPRYALVRPEIRRYRPTRATEPAPIALGKGPANQFRALVSLGEDDPHAQSLPLAKLLLATPKIAKVDVVVSKEHSQIDAIKAFAEANAERVELALEPAEVAARLVRAHFAITAGASWSVELACIGMPQLVLVQNEAHWPNAQRLEEEGCASIVGWHENTSTATIRSAVTNLLAEPGERLSMARSGRNLIDGRGPDRLVNAVEILLAGVPGRDAMQHAA